MQRQDFIYSIAELRLYLSERGSDLSKIILPTNLNSKFKSLIPKYYIDLIDWYNENDPLRKMVVNSSVEELSKDYELTDPIADKSHSPVPGIIHRHRDRCLLMLTNSCSVHCRFCFRKNLLHENAAHFEKSMEYLQKHSEIWEVIFSGGDPFTLTDHFLQTVLKRIQSINHIKTIRFHTRTPAVYPQKVTKSFAQIIASYKPATVVIHINHPLEVTNEFLKAVSLLQNAGVLLLSQTVLLKDVNNNEAILGKLFKKLVENRIKPYYLHHLDLTAGTDHFRVSIEEGKQIVRNLRSSISGICMPEYVIDLPGGYGKVPVFWFEHFSKHIYKAISFEGKVVEYIDPYYQK